MGKYINNKQLLISLILYIVIQSLSYSQSYTAKHYGTEDGLMNDNICRLYQDSLGYLWIGTDLGISKFDGSNFVNYRDSKTDYYCYSSIIEKLKGFVIYGSNNFSGSAILSINENKIQINSIPDSLVRCKRGNYFYVPGALIDNYGNSWCLNNDRLYLFDGKVVKNLTRDIPLDKVDFGDFEVGDIKSWLVSDNKNDIWFCHKRNTKKYFYKYNGKHFVSTEIVYDGTMYINPFIDTKKRVWFIGENKVAVYINKIAKIIKIPATIKNLLEGIGEDKQGNIWIASINGLIKINSDYSLEEFIDNERVIIDSSSFNTICIDMDNNILTGTRIFDGKNYSSILPDNLITEIAIKDKNGNLWIGTNKGLYKLTPSPLKEVNKLQKTSIYNDGLSFIDSKNRMYIRNEDQKNRTFKIISSIGKTIKEGIQLYTDTLDFLMETRFCVYEDNAFNVFIYNGLDKVIKIKNDNTEEIVNLKNRLAFKNKNDKISSLVLDEQNSIIYFMVDEFLYQIKGDKTAYFKTGLKGDKKNNQTITIAKNGNVYIQNDSLLALFNGKEVKILSTNKAIAFGTIVNDDKDKNLVWLLSKKDVSYYCSVIYKYDGTKLRKYCSINKNDSIAPGSNIFKKNNSIWSIGQYGISEIILNNEKATYALTNYNRANGLTSNNCYHSFFDSSANKIWVLSDYLNCISIDDKNKFEVRVYDKLSNNCAFTYHTGFPKKDKNGKIYFIQDHTVNSIDVGHSYENTNETDTYITSLKWEENNYNKEVTDYKNNIVLPYNFKSLEIDFIGICLTDGNKVKYKYKLEGIDDTWQTQDVNFVKYASLPSGKYAFKLLACNNDKLWNKEPVVLKFEILPPFWKTVWFLALCLTSIVASVFIVIRLRTKQLVKKQKELERIIKERTNELAESNEELQQQNEEIFAQRDEIEHQKDLIQEHQKEIVDSITYAKRIQDAILPPIELIKEKFPNSFVLYKPKDIVAGDFYWMEEIGNTILIAAADSTGHGVPGAMVSVVCSNALNRAVKEFHLNDTGKILDKVTELVLETFEKSIAEVKDGMDISMLSINKATRQIQWSGANNPLWYFDDQELNEIKSDKQPIGKSDNHRPFSTHTIDYKPGTTFYLFTDGYADQFGGPNGKKFKYKQFQETLLATLGNELQAQQIALATTFENWKGTLDQVDDVCVIGIKI